MLWFVHHDVVIVGLIVSRIVVMIDFTHFDFSKTKCNNVAAAPMFEWENKTRFMLE